MVISAAFIQARSDDLDRLASDGHAGTATVTAARSTQ